MVEGVSTVRVINPMAKECPLTRVGVYLNILYYGVCACVVGVRLGEGLRFNVKVSEFLITSSLD
jgi:hypothetical protein